MSTSFVAHCVNIISVALVLLAAPDTRAGQSPQIIDVFASRSAWKGIPTEYLIALGGVLRTPVEAREFADVCEKSGVLQNTIRPQTDERDTAWMKTKTALALTHYGNAQGEAGRLESAKTAFEFALLLKPDHQPAIASLALANALQGHCAAAVRLADQVLSIKVDPADERQREKEAAKGLDSPELIGASDAVREQLREIKDKCSQRLQ